MANIRTRAIVLRRTNYGEADRILKLLTTSGERSVIARGVRREKSKLSGGVELFGVSDVTIHDGKGDLGILTSARLEIFFRHILDDYDRLLFGYEATNIVSKMVSQIDEPEWFDVLLNTYEGLDSSSVSLQLVQIWFYVRYAELSGYGLNLERDIAGNLLEKDERYMYDTAERGLRRSQQGDISAEHIKFMRLIAAKPLKSVAQIGGTDAIMSECWLLARSSASI